jgi:hypothetical protein
VAAVGLVALHRQVAVAMEPPPHATPYVKERKRWLDVAEQRNMRRYTNFGFKLPSGFFRHKAES